MHMHIGFRKFMSTEKLNSKTSVVVVENNLNYDQFVLLKFM